MSLLLRIFRIAALFIWVFLVGIMALFCQFGEWRGIKNVSFLTRLWGWGIAKIINLRITVKGDLPRSKGCLIVSNHQSYLDIVAHAAVFPIRFAPKIEISRWPVLGFVLGLSRPVWVDRQSRQKSLETLNCFRETLLHDIPLVVYPEGTTTTGDNGILTFKSTPFGAVASNERKFEILPVLTIYDLPSNTAWYGDMELLPHVWKILAYRHIDVTINVMPPVTPEDDDRKIIAKNIHDIMEREYWNIVRNKKILENTEALNYEGQRT